VHVDWTTVASLATAAGTLVLAVATFAAVRSANQAARTAEHSLLANLRPLFAGRYWNVDRPDPRNRPAVLARGGAGDPRAHTAGKRGSRAGVDSGAAANGGQ